MKPTSPLNSFGQVVENALAHWFSDEQGAAKHPRVQTPTGSAAAGSAKRVRPPFTAEQTGWLAGAVRDSLSAIRAHTDESLTAQESAITAAAVQCEQVAAKVAQVEGIATDAAAQVGAMAGSAARALSAAEQANQRGRGLADSVQSLQAAQAEMLRKLAPTHPARMRTRSMSCSETSGGTRPRRL